MRLNVEWAPEELPGGSRTKVFGGWLVILNNYPTFVPDRDHEWVVVLPQPEVVPVIEEWEK
jgi:hypothetical protein